MHTARTAGVPTPTVFLVDVSSATIIMEFVRGKLVKELFSQVSESKRRSMCLDIGRLIGRLHLNGIVHGDLTTSNMIVNADEKIYFVDFGLGEKTEELEAKGVDLHLMKRALQSTHFVFAEECFAAVVEGYSRIMGAREAKKVLDNVGEIERRGRYVLERKGVKDD
jgi:TP53 regulating kinase-like protein